MLFQSGAAAVLAAAGLDTLIGDPLWCPHPVVLMGKLISRLRLWVERLSGDRPEALRLGGGLITAVLVLGAGSCGWLVEQLARASPVGSALLVLGLASALAAESGGTRDGTTSSSDGQRFRAGGRGESTGHVNPKYGSEPGRLFYTHISDQYAPFSTRVVNVGVRDSTYVLDGLLYHESDLRIEEQRELLLMLRLFTDVGLLMHFDALSIRIVDFS